MNEMEEDVGRRTTASGRCRSEARQNEGRARKRILGSAVLAMFLVSACDGEKFPIVMTKHWAIGAALNGETFDWARFETAAHCAIVARHLNAAKASGQFSDDFGSGDYTFECPR
jgi:hypothetical protein